VGHSPGGDGCDHLLRRSGPWRHGRWHRWFIEVHALLREKTVVIRWRDWRFSIFGNMFMRSKKTEVLRTVDRYSFVVDMGFQIQI
jgi:hypothetical protein